jgi:hypothetical protein
MATTGVDAYMTSYSSQHKLGVTKAVNIYCSSDHRILCGRDGNQFFNLKAADPNTHGGLLHQANAFQTTFQTSLFLLPFRESNFLHGCTRLRHAQ